LREAKAKLSGIVDCAVRGESCVIMRRGRKEAVVLSYEEWERLSRVPSFAQLLMNAPIGPGDLQPRSRKGRRQVDL
jgi:prevent-host-death family protein